MVWLIVFGSALIFALIFTPSRKIILRSCKELDRIVAANCEENELECRRRNAAVQKELEAMGVDSIDEAEDYILCLSQKKKCEKMHVNNEFEKTIIDKERITDDELKALYFAAVKNEGLNLQYVPNEQRTFELCLVAIKQDVCAFQYVPQKIKTSEFCIIAFQQCGYADWSALEFVPEELKTPELCRIAIQQSGCALEFVPDELKTPELCFMAVRASCYPYSEYGFVPSEYFKSPEFCYSIVQMDNWDPRAGIGVWTTELCIEAVRENAWESLPFIPNSFKTLELGLAAVRAQPYAIVLLPRDLRAQVNEAAIAAARDKGYEGDDNELLEMIYEKGHRATEYMTLFIFFLW